MSHGLEKRKEIMSMNRRGTLVARKAVQGRSTKDEQSDVLLHGKDYAGDQDALNPYFIAIREGVDKLRSWVLPYVIRRTMDSRDADGNPIIPPIPHRTIDSMVSLTSEEEARLDIYEEEAREL